jgi:hypothetical protein
LAWSAGPPRSDDPITQHLDFKGALSLELGYAAQLLIACDREDQFSVSIAFPRLEPLYVLDPAKETGSISIFIEGQERWSSETQPMSFGNDVVSLEAVREDGIVELLRSIVNSEGRVSVQFRGLFSWTVRADPPPYNNVARAAAQLPEYCPTLRQQGLSLSPDAARTELKFAEVVLDRWLHLDQVIEITDCAIVAGVEPRNTLLDEDHDYLTRVTREAEKQGFHVNLHQGELVIWPGANTSASMFNKWLANTVATMGGRLLTEPDRAGPVRLVAPNWGKLTNLTEREIREAEVSCAPPEGANLGRLELDKATIDAASQRWAVDHCVQFIHTTPPAACSGLRVRGLFKGRDLLDARIVPKP